MRIILFGLLLVSASIFADEPRFNALDNDDPHYSEFNGNLCRYTADYIQRMDTRLQRLSVQFLALKTSREKLAWLEDFTVSAELKKQWDEDFNNYCGK